MKIMPKKIKVKNTIWKSYSLGELLVALIIFALVFILFINHLKILSLIIGGILVLSYIPVGDDLFYIYILEVIIYLIKPKKLQKTTIKSKSNLIKLLLITNIDDDGIIEYSNKTYAKVIQVGQKNFLLEDKEQQEIDIEILARALNSLEQGTSIDIVKLYKPINFEHYIIDLEQRIKEEENNEIKKKLLIARNECFKKLHSESKEYYSNFYFVIYNTRKKDIDIIVDTIASEISKCELSITFLNKRESAIFLKYNNTRDFDEKEIDKLDDNQLINWINPNNVVFKSNKYTIDNLEASTLVISDYPLKVKNGWGGELFNIDNTKVVMHIEGIEKSIAIKKIDSCILELQTKEALSNTTSESHEAEIHSNTMIELLQKLQSENESLFDVSIYVTCYNYNNDNYFKRVVRNKIKSLGFKSNLLTYQQQNAYITSHISPIKKINKYNRSINSITLASFFPFVKSFMMDKNGILMGKIKSNNHPFIFDLWKRGGAYQNSNAFVIGKSGSGKTYFLKTLLINEFSNNTKIIICDPEAEYTSITTSLMGNVIDVGNAKQGKLNPFQIYQILTEEGTYASPQITFNTHLKTLESFLKIVLEGISNDVIELINMLIIETYYYKGITENTNCNKLNADDYPIFSDLMIVLEQKMKTERDSFLLDKYAIAKLHLNKFIMGRYCDIWNGPSTLKVDASIITFNFQSLFANKNNIVANAQMCTTRSYVKSISLSNT